MVLFGAVSIADNDVSHEDTLNGLVFEGIPTAHRSDGGTVGTRTAGQALVVLILMHQCVSSILQL